ncbi:ABC transporter permease [Streptacidiphilus sp. N1-12]|uniref:ABC transporter permease n=2 Tax=Streptacidiphilus alkalitolerans TaxID=3342712 RepID=A0ABV6VGQ0_9ACTN
MYRTALRNVIAHKGRLLMTMLAVLLGTAFVAGTMVFSDSVGQAFKDSVSSDYAKVSVEVRDDGSGLYGSAAGNTSKEKPLTEQLRQRIAALPGTAAAAGTVTGFAGLSDPGGNLIGSQGDTHGSNWQPGDDGQDARYPMLQGAGPTDAQGIAVDRKTAADNGFKVGDTVRLAVNGPVMQVKVTGIFGTDDPQVKAGGSLVLFDNATAQRTYLKPGQYNSIEVQAKPGVSQAQLRDQVLPLVPHSGNVVVKTGVQLTADETAQVTSSMSGLRTALLAFAAIALFVGIFLITNTFTMLIAQRTRELALMRALGASRRQITNSVLLEALFVGVVASVGGLAAGIGIGALLKSLMSGSGVPQGGLVLSGTTVVATLLTGVVVTVLAALLPSLRASRVAPVTAMSSNDQPATQKSLVVRNSIGAAFFGLGLASVLYGASLGGSSGRLPVGLGAGLILIGVFVLTPLLSRPVIALVGPLLRRLFGTPGKLAQQNAVRNPRRTAATASALTIGLTLISALTVIGASVSQAVDKQVTQNMKADYDVSVMLGQPVSPALVPKIAATPGVAASSVIDSQYVGFGGRSHSVSGVDAASFDQLIAPVMLSGATSSLQQGAMLVDREVAASHGWTVGSAVPVTYPDSKAGTVRIGGIYQVSDMLGPVLMSESVLAPHTTAPYYSDVLVKGTNGASATLQQALKDSTGRNPLVTVKTQQEIRDQFNSLISTMLNIMYGLLGMAVVIAILGVINTLAMSVFERKREIGMLRAIGLDRYAVKRMVRLESVVIAAFGAVMGVAIGCFLAWSAVQLLKSSLVGLTTAPPYGQLGGYVLGAALIGLLAAMWPARRASKLDILGSIKTS